MADPCGLVREGCSWVCESAEHVSISEHGIAELAARVGEEELQQFHNPGGFDRELHFWDERDPSLVAQYLLVVDTLNFCFWPDPETELEYEHLAGGLKRALLADRGALEAGRLAQANGPALRRLLGWPRALPLEEERARLLREVGAALLGRWQGQAANLVAAAGGSAVELVRLVAAELPGFRDHTVYRGRQVFFLKRAQIWVGDLWGAFRGCGLGAFHDIASLTMFADYRVPVVLRELGLLRYSPHLAAMVDGRQQLDPGSQEEVEVRAATVEAVERLRTALGARMQQVGGGGGAVDNLAAAAVPLSVCVDWWLWEQGERQRRQHRPHHRTLTIYY